MKTLYYTNMPDNEIFYQHRSFITHSRRVEVARELIPVGMLQHPNFTGYFSEKVSNHYFCLHPCDPFCLVPKFNFQRYLFSSLKSVQSTNYSPLCYLRKKRGKMKEWGKGDSNYCAREIYRNCGNTWRMFH